MLFLYQVEAVPHLEKLVIPTKWCFLSFSVPEWGSEVGGGCKVGIDLRNFKASKQPELK